MGFGVYWVYIVNSEVNSVRRLKGVRVAAGQLQKSFRVAWGPMSQSLRVNRDLDATREGFSCRWFANRYTLGAKGVEAEGGQPQGC